MPTRNLSSPSSLPTFLSLQPTIAAIHLCCWWNVTTEEPQPLLSKPKSWRGSRPPSPESSTTRSPHTRGPLQSTQWQAGAITMGCSERGGKARVLVAYSRHPSVLTWATEENRCGLCKRGWATMRAFKEVRRLGLTYLVGPTCIKHVTFLLCYVTEGNKANH